MVDLIHLDSVNRGHHSVTVFKGYEMIRERCWGLSIFVRFTPESGHLWGSRKESAFDP